MRTTSRPSRTRSSDHAPPEQRLCNSHRRFCFALGAIAVAAGCATPSAKDPSSPPTTRTRLTNIGTPSVSTSSAAGVAAADATAGAAGNAQSAAGVAVPPVAGSASPIPMDMAKSPQPMTVVDDTSGLPCDISQALASNCQKCHASDPVFGAPMPLVTMADLQKKSKSNPSLTVAQASIKRLNDDASPMPPGANITATDRTLLVDYLTNGKAPAAVAGQTCKIAQTRSDEYLHAGVTAANGETCYDFVNHAGQTPDDKTKYSVVAGEHYEEFLFKVPWGPGMVATKFGSKLDNIKIAHHWLFYSTNKTTGDGSHTTTIGTVLGSGASLLAGWAVGGDNLIFPADVGLELPASGILDAQWHYYNQGTATELDSSAVQVCVVPAAMRKNIAGVTWLGTENFNGLAGMPAHTMSKFSGTCTNNSSGPITIWGFTPHMHKLGRHMNSVIHRKDGTMETVFDRTFDFNAQITYPVNPQLVLDKGESIVSTCTFDNTTDSAVAYGPSTNQEMCYNFTVSYPLGALNDGVTGLNGALNNCW